MNGYQQVIDKVSSAGQAHIIKYWNELSDIQKDKLIKQIESIDFESLEQMYREKVSANKSPDNKGVLEPIDIIRTPGTSQEVAYAEDAFKKGQELLRAGKVATVLVAGGQGSRLGFDGPKGIYPISPIKKKSLFELHAEKILALNHYYHTNIPWYIMTSKVNDSETKKYFEDNKYFGLKSENVFFFIQGMLPAMDENGKLILDSKHHIFENPDGHGGIFKALKDSGALDDMNERNIEEIFYFQIDNVLVKICDPYFLGYHRLAHSEMSAKVVAKRDPYEKVGVIGKVDGKPTVIEYSDLPKSEMEALDADGNLKYNGGSIAIHVLNIEFIEKITSKLIKLPFHVAHKKINYIDQNGDLIEPEESNGYKFEKFIFDALPYAENVIVMEVERAEEFSPVKNENGKDSPFTAEKDLNNFYGKILSRLGVDIPLNNEGNVSIPIEMNPEYLLDINTLKNKIAHEDFSLKDKILIE